VLRGDRVALRPVEAADVPTLRAFLEDPAVGRWWPQPPQADWPFDDPSEVCFAVTVDGELAGLIQYLEEHEPDYRHASIDVFLGSAFHGRGLGPDAVATLVRHLVVERGHHRVTIDPAADNARAIAAYTRAGFRRVGVLRAQERDHAAGGWRDALLMDLLAEDVGLRPGPPPRRAEPG
jgi:aminoglycoside 6'-N-acetyltransferase